MSSITQEHFGEYDQPFLSKLFVTFSTDYRTFGKLTLDKHWGPCSSVFFHDGLIKEDGFSSGGMMGGRCRRCPLTRMNAKYAM